MKKALKCFLATLLIGCGYLENDNIIFDKQIYGKIRLKRNENSNQTNLVFRKYDNMDLVLVEDCERVIYDSINGLIFAENVANEFNKYYYQVRLIINPSSIDSMKYEIYTIERKEFDLIALDSSKIFFDTNN